MTSSNSSQAHWQVPVSLDVRTTMGPPTINRSHYVVGDNNGESPIASQRQRNPIGFCGDHTNEIRPINDSQIQRLTSSRSGIRRKGSLAFQKYCQTVVDSGNLSVIKATFQQVLERYDENSATADNNISPSVNPSHIATLETGHQKRSHFMANFLGCMRGQSE